MTYQQFIQKYVGTKQDFDQNNDVQCVDYARLYVEEVWGITSSRFNDIGGAVDAYTDYPTSLVNGRSDLVELIKNTPDNAPIQGDIVVFNTNMGGGYGHIAIVNSVTLDQVYLTEQNKWGNNDAIMWGQYGYDNVLGWLRKKPETRIPVTVENTQTEQTPINMPENKPQPNFTKEEYKAAYYNNDLNWMLGSLADRDNEIKEKNDQIETMRGDYKILQDKYEAIKKDKMSAENNLILAANNVEAAQSEHIKDLKIMSDNLTQCQEQNKELQLQLAQTPTSTSKSWFQSKKFMAAIIFGLIPFLIGLLVPELQVQANQLYNILVPYLIAQGIVDVSANLTKK